MNIKQFLHNYAVYKEEKRLLREELSGIIDQIKYWEKRRKHIIKKLKAHCLKEVVDENQQGTEAVPEGKVPDEPKSQTGP